MKANRFSILFAATLLAAPFGAYAQSAPQGTIVEATAPGEAGLGASVQMQGKVKSIDNAARTVVVVGPKGNEVIFNLGEAATNFEQIRVGDLVTLTYVQAVALELHKVKNTGIRERDESVQTAHAQPGQKPAGAIQRTVRVVANVVGVSPKAQTITLRGVQHTVELAVKDPAQLKNIKVGDQVEAAYVDTIVLRVDVANK